MSTVKHTPGPWVLGKTYRSGQEVWIDAPKGDRNLKYDFWECLAIVNGSDDYPELGRLVAEANARLIAAAPDLLEEHKEWASLIGQVYILIRQGLSGEAADLIAESEVIDFQNGEPVAVSDAITKAEGWK